MTNPDWNKACFEIMQLQNQVSELAKAIFNGHITAEEPEIDRVIQAVSNEFGQDRHVFLGKRQDKWALLPRYVTAYLLAKAGLGRQRIGKVFKREQSSITHEIRCCENLIATDAKFRARIEKLEKILGGGPVQG